MPPKKGLSQEEKKAKLLEFFNKSHNFYTLKEIEKDGSKYTKLSSILIKDILTDLVNDGLVKVEKCGTTNLYWCFKYDKVKHLIKQQQELNSKLAIKREEKNRLIEKIQAGRLSRLENSDFGMRAELLSKLSSLKVQKQNFIDKLKNLHDNDPNLIIELNNKNSKLIRSIDFFTDNIELMIYYFTKVSLSSIDEDLLRLELGIPKEFDELPLRN